MFHSPRISACVIGSEGQVLHVTREIKSSESVVTSSLTHGGEYRRQAILRNMPVLLQASLSSEKRRNNY
jgi:hypothetical protein